MTPAFSPVTWRPGVTHPQLSVGVVDVWTADLDAERSRLDQYRRFLSDRELKRVERLQVEQVADRFVVSRGILRLLLARYSEQPIDELQFDYGPLGKPSLRAQVHGRILSFNNTDSAGMAIYAFSWDRPLGVDLERLPRRVRAERISRRRFAPDEAREITAAKDADTAFIACWTRKEAWGKAIGLGIRYPMAAVRLCTNLKSPELIVDPTEAITSGADKHCGVWRLLQLRPDENALACIVAEGDCWHLNGWRYNPALLEPL